MHLAYIGVRLAQVRVTPWSQGEQPQPPLAPSSKAKPNSNSKGQKCKTYIPKGTDTCRSKRVPTLPTPFYSGGYMSCVRKAQKHKPWKREIFPTDFEYTFCGIVRSAVETFPGLRIVRRGKHPPFQRQDTHLRSGLFSPFSAYLFSTIKTT